MLREYLKRIADALRSFLGTVDTINAQVFPDKISEVYDAGKQAEHDRFWDNYQQNGNRTDYNSAFNYIGWDDNTFKPKYDIVPTDGYSMFSNCKITDLSSRLAEQGVTLDTSKCNRVTYMFNGYYNATMTHIPAISTVSAHDLQYLFYHALNLHTIDKLILKDDGSQNVANLFVACSALVNLVIEGIIGQPYFNVSYCPHLSHDSLLSIINALKDLGYDAVSICDWSPSEAVEGTFVITEVADSTVYDDSVNVTLDGVDTTVVLHGVSAAGISDLLKAGNRMYLKSKNFGSYYGTESCIIYGTSCTITLGSVNLAKLSDEEKAIATEKGWTLA